MGRRLVLLAGAVLAWAAGPVWGADAPRAVVDYDARLEQIAGELADLRRELEALVAEVAAGDLGRVLVFVDKPPPAWRDRGVRLAVDGATVVARPFTPAELDAFQRGLPVELLDAWLPAGDRKVAVGPLGDGGGRVESTLPATRGQLRSWVAQGGTAGVEWRAE